MSPRSHSRNYRGRTLAVLGVVAVVTGGALGYRQVTGGSGTFPLHVSANGRYLVQNNGSPFLIVGDSPQSGFGQLSTTNMANYLADRAAHGFNTVWEWIPCDGYFGFCNSDSTTYDGIKPFSSGTSPANYDFATPNASYFDRAHSMIAQAQSDGIAVVLNPLEAGNCDGGGWVDGMAANGSTKTFNFGAYLGTKYGDLDNVLWIIGNDYACWATSSTDALYQQLANGILSTMPSAIITLNANLNMSSLDDTTHDWTSILKLNSTYWYDPTYQGVRVAYAQSPTMPVFLNEASYEQEKNGSTDGCIAIRNCRLQEWWTMTSGATGQFYGCHCSSFLTNANYPNGIDTAGVTELGYQTSLLNTIAWQNLVPDTNGAGHLITTGGGSCPTSGNFATVTCITAAESSDGTLALIYAPGPSGDQTFTVDFSKMHSGGTTTARWYDPTNGTYTTVTSSPFTNASGAVSITAGNGAANNAGDHDWALLLQSS